MPTFEARTSTKAGFIFESVAGRYVVLCFFGSAGRPACRAILDALLANPVPFDGTFAAFFGVSIDPADERMRRIQDRLPGVRFFWDLDRRVSRLYNALEEPGPAGAPVRYRPFTLVLDPTLRILADVPFGHPKEHLDAVLGTLLRLPPPAHHAGVPVTAPVLLVPRVFEPDLCRHLIDLYERDGGEDSGFMREGRDGKTVRVLDHGFKRRFDYVIVDPALQDALQRRIARRLAPEVERAFQFRATRIERYLVACYDAATGGYFRPHRDNTTKGTAHRRFAVTINLNEQDYQGSDLRFPEFGLDGYRAPTGGAVVFSCSLLHEAMPVTKGRRFAFLPFLYDEAAARIREQNNAYLGEGLGPYSASPSAREPVGR